MRARSRSRSRSLIRRQTAGVLAGCMDSVSYPLRGASGGASAVFVHFRVKVGSLVDHPGS